MRYASLVQRTAALASLSLSSVAFGGVLPNCNIDFEVSCPDLAPVCGASFSGGNSCAFEFLFFCYSSGLFSYKITPPSPLTITLSGDLNSLRLFFVHQGAGASGEMRFFDAVLGGNEVGLPLATNGDCLVVMHPLQLVEFTTPVRRIEVTATGALLTAVWIDDFHVNPCPTDITGDGTTNVLDLVDLLLCFGLPAIPGCEAEDVNGDGSVNVLDLIDLLLEFGQACR